VGDDREYYVDVRIVAATNKDLDQEVERGHFRRDLYERLKQIVIFLPPLSERAEDIPKLVYYFLDKWNTAYGESKRLSAACWDHLLDYEWPGNVREVENVIINLCASCKDGEIGPELLNPALRAGAGNESGGFSVGEFALPESGIDLKAFLHQAERQFFEKAIEMADGNRETAARLLGLNGPAFRKACRERFGIE
jgi:DNA-binding NtrC family response regulator